MVATISHTEGRYVAAVAEAAQVAALGIDCEVVGHVSREIWSSVCGDEETDWLESLPADERQAAVTFEFSQP